MFALLLLAAGADPAPKFEVINKVPPAFTVVNRLAPADRFTAADGTTYERGADGYYRAVRAAPGVAAPRQPFRPSGGCGCTVAANCGAGFCKSRGGTGCPESCPVKQQR